MYILQFINDYTQEILREENYEKLDLINELIDSCKESNITNEELIFFDDKRRKLIASFVSHHMLGRR